MADEKENPFEQEYLSDHQSVSLQSSSRTVSRDSVWSVHIDKHAVAIAFNELATAIHLDPLALNKHDETEEGFSYVVAPVDGTFLAKENEPLRRRDRVLESLARLGGHSFLSLPVEFAPGTLRLPTCFVATISYLKCSDVFCNAGDSKLAARTYEYFANHVLSAEKEQDQIEMTVRRGEMPLDLIGILDRGASRQPALQMLSVAWVFKALLAGLPGGVLGSAQLYRLLVSICYGRTIEGDNEARRDCASGLSPQGQTRVQAMGLAVLALTTPMQLNLICAFFGLCAMLVYETELVSEHGDSGSPCHGINPGLLSVERLGRVLGPLLTPERGVCDQDTFRAIEREIESQRVMTMLIASWYNINRLLRQWQNQGSFSRNFSWEPSLAGAATRESHVN
ncbi:hypothetical protein BBP40_004670 [Aspergillus hancockii]|nr:hypothetical protein BBP40_004670 [Aspergillus hancockii]